jgi:hypothetical protein
MRLTIELHPSWLALPTPLATLLDHVRALESTAPWSPSPGRQPGDDEDLAALLDGIAEPAPVAAAPPPPAAVEAPQPAPARSTTSTTPEPGIPADGKSLYRWATWHKCLPDDHRIGKAHRYDRVVSNWQPHQVVNAYRILTELAPTPAANGPPR